MCGLTKVGLKKRFAYAFSLCAVAMIWLCLISPQEAVSGGKDWFGTVTIWETLRAEYGGSTEEREMKFAGECGEEWDAMVNLQYCSGNFYVEEVTYSFVHRASSKTTGPDKGCRFNPIVSSSCRKLYTERSKEEPKFGDALNVRSDGTYRLNVDGDIKATTYIFEESISKIKCGTEDYIKIIVTDPYTGAMNGLPDKEVATWESVLGAVNDRGTRKMSPGVIIWPCHFLVNGRVSDEKRNVIEGKTKLDPTRGNKSKQGCYIVCGGSVKKPEKNKFEPKKMASWFFTTDPCEYVNRELESAKKIKEAYEQMSKDPKTANMNGTAFNNYVKGKLTSDDLSPSAPMRTYQENCATGDLEEIREKRYKCLPEIVFKADKAHEQVHIDTCNSKGPGAYGEYLQDKNNYAKDDTNAYNKKIEVLENWLNKNCPNWRR